MLRMNGVWVFYYELSAGILKTYFRCGGSGVLGCSWAGLLAMCGRRRTKGNCLYRWLYFLAIFHIYGILLGYLTG